MERTSRKLMSILGIGFDLEGTIIDIESLHHNAHLKAALDAGVNISLEEAYTLIPNFVGGPDEEVAISIAKLAREKVSVQEILLAKKKHFRKLLEAQNEISPRPGFCDFLNWVKDLNLPVGIGTVTSRQLALQLLSSANLLSKFEENFIVTREDVSQPKPFPDVYYALAIRLKIPTNRMLVFEDSLIGLSAASSAGCRVVSIPTIQDEKYFESHYQNGAEFIFKSWVDPEIKKFVGKAASAYR